MNVTITNKKALVAGWFSFDSGHATGGDLLAMNVTCEWLEKAGYAYDVAFDPPFEGGVNWRVADPEQYSHVVFVCGPFEQGDSETDFFSRFHNCRLIGLNLTMLVPIEKWNPFDLLFERDSSLTVRPDVVFASKEAKTPVVGICLVEPYLGALDGIANEAIQRLIAANKIAIVNIDTRLDHNLTHLRSPAEIESLIASVDMLVTTRLHGAVMAIKNGVPVIAIDPEAGGAKIVKQMQRVGWPIVFSADALSDEELQKSFDYCLTEKARIAAVDCYRFAISKVEETSEQFIAAITINEKIEQNFLNRLADPLSKNWFLERIAEREKEQHEKQLAAMKKAEIEQSWRFKFKKQTKKILQLIALWTLPKPFFDHVIYLAKSLK